MPPDVNSNSENSPPLAVAPSPVALEGARKPRDAEQRAKDAEKARLRRAKARLDRAKAEAVVAKAEALDGPGPGSVESSPVVAEAVKVDVVPVWPSLEDCKAGVAGVRGGLEMMRGLLAEAGMSGAALAEGAKPPMTEVVGSLMLGPAIAKLSKTGDLNQLALTRNLLTPDVLAVVGIGVLLWPYVGEHVVSAAKWCAAQLKGGS